MAKYTHICVSCSGTREKDYPLDTYICFWCKIKRDKANQKARNQSKAIKKQLITEAGGKVCARCGQEVSDIIMHHTEPVALGGKTTKENTELLCSNCHKQAHADEKLQHKGYRILL